MNDFTFSDKINKSRSHLLKTFPFVKSNGIRKYMDTLVKPYFPTIEVLQYQDEFISAIKNVYKQEKIQSPLSNHKKTSIDKKKGLKAISNVENMYFHVRIHAVTGLLEWGTSTTYSIPYWDIQALWFGLVNTVSIKEARAALERNHIESVQALLAYMYTISNTYKLAKKFLDNMNNFIRLGNVTRSNLTPDYIQAKNNWEGISNRLEEVIKAKYKHLLFTVDQIHSEKLRKKLITIVHDIDSRIDFQIKSFSLDLGVDAGLTKDTYRPLYQIVGFAQLAYVGVPTYSVDKKECPVFTHSQLMKSISRKGNSGSNLIDPSRDILLPWKF